MPTAPASDRPFAPPAPPRTLRVILNGKHAAHDAFRAAVAAVRRDGHTVDVQVTYEEGDGARFARDAAADGVDTIVAAGGDGTINEVAQGLADGPDETTQPSVGIVPLGTANDFASACEIPVDPLDALRLAVRPPVPVDLGRVNDRIFVNMATGGFGTEVTVATPDEMKKLLGRAAYMLTGLAHCTNIRPVPARLTGPGFTWEGEFLVLAVGNGRQAGGGHLLCPHARIDDGALDVRIVPAPSDRGIGEVLHALLSNGLPTPAEDVTMQRLEWLEIEAPEGLHLNLDGEPISGSSFRFELQPGRIRLHVPPAAAVLQRHPTRIEAEPAGSPE